jgi:2-polyprenyl-3-methyl-5-hydroxy-6-metoxy-1,4-benzoquinol methylase
VRRKFDLNVGFYGAQEPMKSYHLICASRRRICIMAAEYKQIPIAGGDTSQPLAMRKRLSFLHRHLMPGRDRFLDCGCGAGDYVFQLVDQFGLNASGIEYDQEKVRRGQLNPKHGHRITQGDIQALSFGDNEFHYVMLNEVLEHVPNDSAALREV